MHSVLSFIHLLLVFSHNRIMPEMKAVWQAIMQEKVAVKQERSTLQIPFGFHQQLPKAIVYRDDRTKISPAHNSFNIIRYPVLVKLSKGVSGPPRSAKRYLVFCQMKLEG